MREELIVALGTRRYRVQRPFGDLPAGPGLVSDAATDRRGHIFVLMRRDSQKGEAAAGVVELAPDGTRLAEWGSEIADGHMLVVGDDDRIHVVDRDAHEVIVYDLAGRRIGGLGQRHAPGQPFGHPTDVALMPDGRVVVSDGYGNAKVHVFSAEGERLRAFGEIGVAPGSFITPHAVWPIGQDRIVVADRENHRLQLFGLDGTLIDVWTGFFRPQDIWGDRNGHLYVTDSVPSLTMLTETGKRLGRCRPVLNGAHGVTGDARTGTLYLAEGNPSRLTRLDPIRD
jgi:DNA-binding beta-propeller fold protein YncE